MRKSKKISKYIIFFYLMVLFIAIFFSYRSASVSKFENVNALFISNSEFNQDFTNHRISKNQVGIQEYTVNLSVKDFHSIQSDVYYLFINKITDNALRVSLNDNIIGQVGDMDKGRSNLKNSPNTIIFDSKLIKENNTLKIETYSTYKSGIYGKGIYITDYETGLNKQQELMFYGERIIVLGLGFLLFSSVFMVIIYFFSKTNEKAFIYAALSSLFASIFFQDFVKAMVLPTDYFIYKKIFMASLYIGVFFYTLAMVNFIGNKIMIKIGGITLIGFLLGTIIIDNLIDYKTFYQYWYILLTFNILMWTVYSIRNLKKQEYTYIFLLGFGVFTIYLSFVIVPEYFGFYFSANEPLFYIIIIALLPMLLGIEDILNKEEKISNERKEREKEYINSVTDNMTGAKNQRYIYMRLNDQMENLVITMFDIDNFKGINDQYGHLAGDYVLKEISRFIFELIRKTDDLCRYGGDEFIIFLYGCTVKKAHFMMEELRKKIEGYSFTYNNQKIDVTVSIGIYRIKKQEKLEDAIEKVDTQLYEAKKNGKNSVSIYQEK